MEKAPANLAGAFFSSISILVDQAELIRHFPGENISFAMCWLWGFPQIGGVDRIWSFWGVYGWRGTGKTDNDKNNSQSNSEIQGSLHYATDDETVRCFGRDDVVFGGRDQRLRQGQQQGRREQQGQRHPTLSQSAKE
jgi:hypothetical protein